MFFQVIDFWNPEGRAMKTVFLLLLLLSTGGCAAKQWTLYLHHFAEGFQRAQERGIRLCWQAGCFWNGPGLCPRHGLALKYQSTFAQAAQSLISSGQCREADFREWGGWMKSVNDRSQPIYFIYCGGPKVSNRLYLNTETGEVFR